MENNYAPKNINGIMERTQKETNSLIVQKNLFDERKQLIKLLRSILMMGMFIFSMHPSSYAQSNQFITTAGTGTWTVPPGVTSFTVECWGAGGAGGGALNNGGSGGAGGCYSRKAITTATPGTIYYYNLPGTAAGVSNGTGTTGGDAWLATTNSSATAICLAKGGPGGTANSASGAISSTTGCVGDLFYKGGNGGAGSTTTGGAGGGGAGSTGAGGNATTTTAGTGTSLYGGAGGAGVTTNVAGNAGVNFGGGGGAAKTGATARAGGAGAQGLIRITYYITGFPFYESADATSTTIGAWSVNEAVAGATYHWALTTADGTYGAGSPAASTRFFYLNVFNALSTYNTYNLYSPVFTLGSTAKQLRYKYWLGNSGYTSSPVPLAVQISVNGGAYTTIYSHTTTNSTFGTTSTSPWTENAIDLTSYAGSNVQFKFISNSNYGYGYCDQGLDEIYVEDKPNPPTVSGFSPLSGCGGSAIITINGTNFTASSVVKFNGVTATSTYVSSTQLTATVPATATSGTISVTNTAGTGTSASSFTVIPGTPAPTASAATLLGASNFTANWAASTGATGYYLDVATDAAFTAFVTGYNNLNVGNVLTYPVTGLSAGTYYYRVRATNGTCTSGNSGTITVVISSTFTMPASGSSTIMTCAGTVYDPGGTGNYAISQTSTITIYPATAGTKVRLTFNTFATEACCDYLTIYNGNSTTAAVLGGPYYNTNPGTVTSTAADGSLTLYFYSDISVVAAGFDATISCWSPCTAPTTQASAITAGSISSTSTAVNWTNGNGAGRVVYINTTNSFTAPTNGTTVTANATYAGTGQQCVFSGTGSGPVTVSGLSPSTTYYVRVYEYCSDGMTYNTSTATGNPNSFTTAASCVVSGDQTTYGSGSWIGYVYNSATPGAFTTYQGYVTEATSFNRTHATTATGASVAHCSTNADLFAIRYKNTTNFAAGYYSFTVGGDDGVRFSIDGGATWLINQWVDQGYTTVSSAYIYLSGPTNMVFEYYENTGTAPAQSSFGYTYTSSPIVPTTGTNTYIACSGTIYDAGLTGNYSNSSNGTAIIYPATAGNKVSLTFNSFAVETCCDNLKIYNGNSTAATLLGTYTASPGTITSTAADGSLTLVFTSDGSVVAAGFDATIQCVGPPTISSFTPSSGCAGTTSVTITGTNFTGTSAVNFNGVSATYTVVSSTSITATAPATATAGAISVVNSAGTATSVGTFTPVAAPLAPVANAATAVSNTGFTANWAASTGATGYYLDIATDAAFTAFVTGYNNLNVGTALTRTVTGLSAITTYYYRVRATNGTCTSASSNTITVTTGFFVPASGTNTYTTCSGTIYDPGLTANYPNSASGTTTIYPATAGNVVQLVFNSFSVETCCDNLKIYNGNSTAAPLMGTYTANPGTITSGAADGSLTLVFTSDGSINNPGFDATISCVPPPPSFKSSWVSMNTGSANWCPGETRNVTVTVTNSGTATWTDASPDINIGVKWNADPDYLVRVNAGGLAPGATQTYTLSVTAPTTTGSNNLTFDVVDEGCFWFANNTSACGVICGPGNVTYASANLTIQNSPTSLNAGAGAAVCSGTNYTMAASIPMAKNYKFTRGNGTVTTLTAPISLLASIDDGASAVTTLPFTFNFDGVNYTQFSVNSNGLLAFGATQVPTTFSNAVASTTLPEVMAFWDDLISAVNYQVFGTAPNRQVVIDWNGTDYSSGLAVNFQCILNETSNIINVVYNTGAGGGSADIGIAGSTTNFLSVTTSPNSFSNVTANDNVTMPASGKQYTFTPPTFTYSWSPSTYLSSTSVMNPVVTAITATTTYTLTATNATGCSSTSTVTITVNPLPTITGTLSACIGNTTALTGSGSPNATNPWISSNTAVATVSSTGVVTGVSAGTSTITYTNSNGCMITATVTIYSNPVASLGSQTNVSCFGGSNGSATIIASGGSAPYSYSWSPSGGTAATATGLAAGTYTCTVTTANGCTASKAVTITQPASAISASVSAQTNVLCYGNNTGSATVTASGGTGTLTYSWNTSPVQTGATASGLAAGSYTCTVTDANGCTTTAVATITQPASIISATISAQTNILCYGGITGSATVAASGGTGTLTYSWNTTPAQTTATATGLAAGSYTCTVTDANGCTRTVVATITQPASAISASVSAQTNVLCYGSSTGSATVTASGGTGTFTYSWNTSPVQTGATASGLAAGSYTCTVTDANGCTNTVVATITQPASAISASVSAQTNILCYGGITGSATVAASGGTGTLAYSWNTTPAQTTATATGLAAGSYTCTVTDANGCTTTAIATITQPASTISAIVSSQTDVLCYGGITGSATVSASGGTGTLTYSWNTSPVQTGATATGLAAGSYTCTVTDANGCAKLIGVNITQPTSAISASVSAQTNIMCYGGINGSATVSASGGTGTFTYSWNTSPVQTTATASGLAVGSYTCTVTDANGCTTSAVANITQPAAVLNASISAQTNVLCYGGTTGSATAGVTGGTTPYTYTWNSTPAQTTATATGLAAGSYTCTVTDANGCTTTAVATISQASSPLAATVSQVPGLLCAGGTTSVVVSASGGTSPYTGTGTISGVAEGHWTYTVTDSNGCTSAATITLISNDITAPVFGTLSTVTSEANLGCSASAASVGLTTPSVTDNCSVQSITNDAPATFPIGNTIVTWTATDNNGNQSTATQTVTITPSTAYASTVSLWNGSVDSSWFNAANWCGAGIPTQTKDAVILSGAPNYPILSSFAAKCNNLTIQNGGSIMINGTGKLSIYGNIDNNGTFTSSEGNLDMSGTAGLQTWGGNGINNFANLNIFNPSGISLNDTITVNTDLEMIGGNITTNSYMVAVSDSIQFHVFSGHINGNILAHIHVGSGVGNTFPIGDNTQDLPMGITFSNVTTAGDVKIRTVQGDYPGIGSSSFAPTQTLNRYWDFINYGVVFDDYSVDLTINTAELDPSVNPVFLHAGVYSSGTWNNYDATPSDTNIYSISGITSLGAVQLGQLNDLPIIDQIIAAEGYIGQTATFEIHGHNYSPLATIYPPTGITVNSYTVNSDTMITMNITIPSTFARGDYYFQVINPAPGGGVSDPALFHVFGNVAADFSSSAFSVTCSTDGSVEFYNNSIDATDYSWNFGTGATPATATGPGPYTVTYSSTGYKTITLVASNMMGSNTKVRTNYINVTNSAPAKPTFVTGPSIVCGLLGTNITYSIVPVLGATNYTWTAPTGATIVSGQGTTSVVMNFAYTYVSGNISVTASNACGTSLALAYTVSKYTAMPGTISGPTATCGTTSATYSIAAVAGASSYLWTLPTGMTVASGSSLTGTSVTVNIASTYTSGNISVVAVNACGNSAARTLTVYSTPTSPLAISGPTSPCGVTSATYSIAAVTGATSYSWTLPTGMTVSAGSSLTGTSVTVDIASTFTSGTISVTANNSCGASPAKTLSITTVPGLPGVISGPTIVCATTATYSITAVPGAISYTWTLPAGITLASGSTGTSNSINVNIASSFASGTISVTANSTCGASAARTLAIANSPAMPGVITGATVVCPSTSTYSITAVAGATSYTWTLPAGMNITTGTSSTGTSISVDITSSFTSGNISVVSNSACASSAARTLAVTKTVATPGVISGPTATCGLTTATYSVTAVVGATSYTWSLPTGMTGTSSGNSITTTIASGFLGGTIGVTANTACTSSAQRTLVLSSAPAQPGVISGPAVNCATGTYTIAAVTGATGYLWTVPTGITILSGQNTTSINVTVASTFVSGNISVVSQNSCTSSAVRTFSVTSKPATPATITGPTALCGLTTATFTVPVTTGVTYNWTMPSGSGLTITGGAGTNTITVSVPADPGSGNISVTANNSCGYASAAKTLAVTGCHSMSNQPILETVDQPEFASNLYPNPAIHNFNLEINAKVDEEVLVEMYDVLGNKIMEKHIHIIDGFGMLQADINDINAGNYVIIMTGLTSGNRDRKMLIKN